MPAPFRIRLDFYHPWPHHAPLFAARAQGFWSDLNQEVEISCGDPFRGDALAYLERGEIDFGLRSPGKGSPPSAPRLRAPAMSEASVN